jgi:hypothetical protein
MMKTHNCLLAGITLASVVMTAGCVKIWQKNVDIKTYMVRAERAGAPIETAQPGKLWIDEVTVLPPYNVRNLVMRKSDVEFGTSYYTELLLSPAENFRNNFYTWFAASGLFNEVSIAERVGMTHRLVATVIKFHGDQDVDQAVLKIKVTLMDEKTKGMRVMLSKDYEQHIDVAEFTAENLIRAYNEALTLILANCEQDMAKLF